MLPGFMKNVRNVGIDLVKFSQNYIINEKYAEINESEALRICVKDAITDGKSMGFGLYSTSLLARDAGLKFEGIRSI